MQYESLNLRILYHRTHRASASGEASRAREAHGATGARDGGLLPQALVVALQAVLLRLGEGGVCDEVVLV
jgi:hypothetical protein